MFERFTDRARHVMVQAREEARALNHQSIGTEHLLLAVVAETEGISTQAMASHGLDANAIRMSVLEEVGHGTEAPPDFVPYSPDSKKMIEMTLREALGLKHNYIGTEHLLLGLMREHDGVAAQVLIRHGANLDDLRETVRELAKNAPKPPEPDPDKRS